TTSPARWPTPSSRRPRPSPTLEPSTPSLPVSARRSSGRSRPVAVREVGDVVRILHEVTEQLTEMNRSDLETLNSTLMHAQDHVAFELNSRANRRNRGIEADPQASD